MAPVKNVLGTDLKTCSNEPLTGFYRDGCCNTGADDVGIHTICVEVTAEFLEFSRSRGNDLITPMPMFGFAGLKPGDHWCLCVMRWVEAFEAGVAPKVDLEGSHISVLEFVSRDDLERYSLTPRPNHL
ncbi:MAG: DUF2237 domain-containing protein [Chloroflexota bacterium]